MDKLQDIIDFFDRQAARFYSAWRRARRGKRSENEMTYEHSEKIRDRAESLKRSPSERGLKSMIAWAESSHSTWSRYYRRRRRTRAKWVRDKCYGELKTQLYDLKRKSRFGDITPG